MKISLVFSAPLFLLWNASCPTQSVSNAVDFNKLKSFLPVLSNKEMFKSKNGKLSIKTSANKSVQFIDKAPNTDDTNSRKYSFLGCIDVLNSFIVQEAGYELNSIIMITKNGEKLKLWSIPYASSDGKAIVCLSQGLETDLVPNGIQVFQMKNGEVASSCEIHLKHYEPQSLRWLDNRSFILKSQTLEENEAKSKKYYYKKFVLK